MIAYMCGVLGGYQSSYYAGIMLLFLLISLVMPWQARYTFFNCMISYIAYVILAYTPDYSLKDLVNNSYFMLSTVLVALS